MTLTLSGSGTIGGLVAGGLPDATVTNAELVTMDGAKVTGDIAAAQITSALNASGSAPVYACRAWVNFNGQGTVAIRASGNVSSITDLGTGLYQMNFTTNMPDANYSVTGMVRHIGGLGFSQQILDLYNVDPLSVSSCILFETNYQATQQDSETICVSIFR